MQLPWPHSRRHLPADALSTQADALPPATAAAAVAASLALLQELLLTYPAAARLVAGALQQSDVLAAVLCSGLSCGLEAIVTPLLQCVGCCAVLREACISPTGLQAHYVAVCTLCG